MRVHAVYTIECLTFHSPDAPRVRFAAGWRAAMLGVEAGAMHALPPYALLLGLRMVEADGRTLFAMPFGDAVLGRPGYLHGGAIAGLLEFAAFGAVRDALCDPAIGMKPVGVSIDFLRGGAARETWAAGTVRKLGRRVANVEAHAWQEDEAQPIATARMNMLLVRP